MSKHVHTFTKNTLLLKDTTVIGACWKNGPIDLLTQGRPNLPWARNVVSTWPAEAEP